MSDREIRDTQNEMVLRLLRDKPEGFTSLEALTQVGSLRLAARILDLRAAGHNITATMVERNGKHVALYQLVERSAPAAPVATEPVTVTWYCVQCGGNQIANVQPSSDSGGHTATGTCSRCSHLVVDKRHPAGVNKNGETVQATLLSPRVGLVDHPFTPAPDKARRADEARPIELWR